MGLTQIKKAGLDELALDHVFTIGASGTDHYTFDGEGLNGTVNDPTLYLTRGKTYRFENGTGAHPIRIQSTSGASGTAYNTGVTNNAGSGTVIIEVQHDAPDVLYYQCTSHANMNGILYITGALADGGVTTAKIADSAVTETKIATGVVTQTKIADNAVIVDKLPDNVISTAKINNLAVTTGKIAADAVDNTKIADNSINSEHYVDLSIDPAHLANAAVEEAKLANNAVTTAKIADEAVTLAKLPHGTGSNDGKFLRANNGADPTFETISTTPADGSITEAKLATGAVTNSKIGGGEITDNKIADGAIIAGKIATNAVEAAKIQNNAVTTDKIADEAITSAKIIGNSTDFDLERKKLLLPRGHQIYNNYSGNSGGDISNTYGTSLDGMPYGKGFGWKQYSTYSSYVAHNVQLELYRIANTPCGMFILEMSKSQSQGGNPYGNSYNNGLVIVAFESAHHGWAGGNTTTMATRGTLYGSYTTSNAYAIYVTGGSGGSYARVTVFH